MKTLVLAFFVIAVTSFAADDTPLRLTLSDSPLTVTFTNTGKEPLRILKPLDGSDFGWLMPHYLLTITDDSDRVLRYLPRCGNHGLWGDLKWPDDYLVVIPPGGTFAYQPRIIHQITVPGAHTLRFQYIFRPTAKKQTGLFSTPFEYPDGLWVGEATSNEIKKVLIPPK